MPGYASRFDVFFLEQGPNPRVRIYAATKNFSEKPIPILLTPGEEIPKAVLDTMTVKGRRKLESLTNKNIYKHIKQLSFSETERNIVIIEVDDEKCWPAVERQAALRAR